MGIVNKRCDDCETGPLLPVGCYFEVTGWEAERSQGGTNTIAARKRTGRMICGGCMAVRKGGHTPKQGKLIG